MKKIILATALSTMIYPLFSIASGVDVIVQNNTKYSVLKSYHICGRVEPQYMAPMSSEVINLISTYPLYLTAQGMTDEPLLSCEVGVNYTNETPTVWVKDNLSTYNFKHFTCKLDGTTVVIEPHE